MQLIYYSAGWLKVTKKLLFRLRLHDKISSTSRMEGDYAYLIGTDRKLFLDNLDELGVKLTLDNISGGWEIASYEPYHESSP